ncbi:MAG: sialate O-acetylesterase [Armatimonadota bacterium]|nr:sialate O-acetylesterase [Armatimonadota bacterium]
MYCKPTVLVMVSVFALVLPLGAAVKPNGLFTDNAVLQQGIQVPIWGTAADGERVTVQFAGQTVSTTAKDGKWMVRLKPLKAGGPYTLRISGSNTVELKNIMVGEVWIASGQSNMQWPLAQTLDAERAIASANDPLLRLYTVPRVPAAEPARDVSGSWVECTPETVKDFSAVAYYFARSLRQALNVPVGIIHSSWGGTRVEAWTSLPVLQSDPDFNESISEIKDYGTNQNHPGALYNGMIAPLVPYAIRGAIWYQGESNARQAYRYEKRLTNMITNWRKEWGQGDFPFLMVQLAPFGKVVSEPTDSSWAELREAQLMTSLHCPNTAVVVTLDVGDPNDIHPKNKQPVGERLALAARALAYGEKVDYKGPRLKSAVIKGDRVILEFTDTGGGLEAVGGPLTGFAIAGADGKFHNAQATIVGDRVVVSSPEVPNPVAVRYAWADAPIANLFGKNGLPASPFRTDNWPLSTAAAAK